jgi:hypothetical protein
MGDPNSSNLAMRVSLTRLDTVKGGLSNSRKKTSGSPSASHHLTEIGYSINICDRFRLHPQVYLLIAELYRILEGNAIGTQKVETDCLDVDDLSDLA